MSAVFKSWPTEPLRNVCPNFREHTRRSINSKTEYGFFPFQARSSFSKIVYIDTDVIQTRGANKDGRTNDPSTQSVFNALASQSSCGIFGPSVRGTLLRLFMWHSLPSTLLEPFRYSIFLFNFFFSRRTTRDMTELSLNCRRLATTII